MDDFITLEFDSLLLPTFESEDMSILLGQSKRPEPPDALVDQERYGSGSIATFCVVS